MREFRGTHSSLSLLGADECVRPYTTLLGVGIAQVAFRCEVFAEAVQVDMFHLRGLAHVTEAWSGGERD